MVKGKRRHKPVETMFTSSQPVGAIVAAFPGASNLFKASGIDFCCGGGRPLGDALRQRGIPEQPFLAALHQAYAEAQHRREAAQTDWRQAPLSTLIDQIVNVHHAYLKQELPLLEAFVNKIHLVHGERHPELQRLNEQYGALKSELESHLSSEETDLFPKIRAYEQTGAGSDLARALDTLEELEAEHLAAGNLLAAMRTETSDYTLPADACRTYTLAFQKLADLESDLFNHIHLENNILFQRLRQARDAAVQSSGVQG